MGLQFLHPSSRSFTASPQPSAESLRIRKRQRIDSVSSITSVERTLLQDDSFTSTHTDNSMRLHETEEDSTLAVSFDSTAEAGPSSPLKHNGVSKTNGFSSPYSNGNGKVRILDGLDGHSPNIYRSSIARVTLPGTTLYEDSNIDREEFVRLTIQSLRDLGYMYVFITSTSSTLSLMFYRSVASLQRH